MWEALTYQNRLDLEEEHFQNNCSCEDGEYCIYDALLDNDPAFVEKLNKLDLEKMKDIVKAPKRPASVHVPREITCVKRLKFDCENDESTDDADIVRAAEEIELTIL